VNDDIGSTWSYSTDVASSHNGTFSQSFVLPSTFVAQYRVTATGSSGDSAVTTFTDSAPIINISQHEGQRSDGTYTSGNITTYRDLDQINFRFGAVASGTGNGDLQVRYTADDGTCLFFQSTFALGTVSGGPADEVINNSGATPTVTTVGPPTQDLTTGEWVQDLHIDFTAAGDATINYHLTLSDEADNCNGSSQHSRLDVATATAGGIGNPGKQNVPLPANQLIQFPDITVNKKIDRDGNGTFEDTAAAGEFCFSLNGDTCSDHPTDANGQVFFPNAPGSTGNLPLNFINGPWYFNWNGGFYRNFKFGEGGKQLQLRMEAFNVLNNTDFFIGESSNIFNVGSTTFGRITSSYSGRIIQFGARFDF